MKSPVHVLFIGNVQPWTWDHTLSTASATPAGVLWQQNLLSRLQLEQQLTVRALSLRPTRLFPGSRILIERYGRFRFESATVERIPFVNLLGLRQLTAGLFTCGRLFAWAASNRGRRRVILQFNLTEPPGMLTLLAARLSNTTFVPLVMDINIPGQTTAASLRRRIDFKLQQLVLPRCDGLIAATAAIAGDFAPKVATVVVDGAIDESDPVFQTATSESLEVFRVLYAGGLEEFEGIDSLIDAFGLLDPARFELTIAGDGPLRSAVEEAALTCPHISYLGSLRRAEIQALYRSADLLALCRKPGPAVRYVFPSKLFEYMASGVPVLSTDFGHVTRDYGAYLYLLIDAAPESIAARIEDISRMGPDDRLSLGSSGRDHIRTSRTWSTQADRIVAFIDSVVSDL